MTIYASTMKTYSLRRRLIWWISLSILMATLCSLFGGYLFARHEIEEVYDAQLVNSAKVLLQLSRHEIIEDESFDLGIKSEEMQHKYERNLGFRIWYNGNLILKSTYAADFGNFDAAPGFSTAIVNGTAWRFFVYIDAQDDIRVEVSERIDVRYELITQLMLSILLPSMVIIPFVLSVIWLIIRNSLRPLNEISADVNSRTPNDLHAIGRKSLPQEIAPLIEALNRLFIRIEESFRHEREFTDNAAHELRTPLAAMKTQTQVLMKKAIGMKDSAESLENLESSIDRATRMVEQLLALARLQNESLEKEDMDLSKCIENVAHESVQSAHKKSISLMTQIATHIKVLANQPSIEMLLRNVIDNAIKYTPDGGDVRVSLDEHGIFKVIDSGAGLSSDDKIRVFERFYRNDKSGQTGSGLGLSIVKYICDVHDFDIQIQDNEPKGSVFVIRFTTDTPNP